MDLVVRPGGVVAAVYTEDFDFQTLGTASIRRASHVEPDGLGRWRADLSPVGGLTLGPFTLRSQALAAETTWLGDRLADLPLD